ncbi:MULTISPECIES: hypothetical protein [unclassified Rhizobium]|uniref:hypothetical protein n=1 Tax=unclassified Rhizobium TaxID=2613769 RepID=UPI0007E9D71F|nr:MULTISPECIES: hypothetical protein [unclassified Rhizobium]ANM10787.1 hypothetical protein AMK05_CH02411 [Rhizobium sp. N324]ANM17329.1 hypothetical protein AMK06_CH02437 [Rhizobium sp. N541]ANM23714.1 hypothetical protein AMK07_CH02434 [Rhizobium sp. N941]OYD04388.1 hypothetical protein AMK08_CH102430 [Rhizobium sp. N4311]
MKLIEKRVVLHFPGFEPLDGAAHRARYERSAKQSAAVWGYSVEIGAFAAGSDPLSFEVTTDGGGAPGTAGDAASGTAGDAASGTAGDAASGTAGNAASGTAGNAASGETGSPGWQAKSRIHMVDHDMFVRSLRSGNTVSQIIAGFRSCAQIMLEGGMRGYFRHAWRFGLFFLFPFLLTALAMALTAQIAVMPYSLGFSPWHMLWSGPLGLCFFIFAFLPFSERFHTLHLFADWKMAVALGRMDRADFNDWLEDRATAVREALTEEADEYVISSHSMGSNVAAHVIGILLEREPEIFKGKRVVFATLGSAILQCALLSSARMLRARVGLIACCPDISWLDVQCLTDSINFYKVPVVAVSGHADAPPAKMILIRVKQMLTRERYRRIRKDQLRVHRQYVLGPDLQAPFDFTLMTSGPTPASVFADSDAKRMPG